MRISDWSSDVCCSDLMQSRDRTTWDDPSKRSVTETAAKYTESQLDGMVSGDVSDNWSNLLIQRAEAFKQEAFFRSVNADRSEEHTSELQSLMRISYAGFCLKTKNSQTHTHTSPTPPRKQQH